MSDAITNDQVPDAWIADQREPFSLDQYVIRAGRNAEHCIEIKKRNAQDWGVLMLPGSGLTFSTAEDRDKVLARLRA